MNYMEMSTNLSNAAYAVKSLEVELGKAVLQVDELLARTDLVPEVREALDLINKTLLYI